MGDIQIRPNGSHSVPKEDLHEADEGMQFAIKQPAAQGSNYHIGTFEFRKIITRILVSLSGKWEEFSLLKFLGEIRK